MHSKLKYIVLIIVPTYILYLGFSGKLALYVHPRYIVFTVVFSFISLVLALAATLTANKNTHNHKDSFYGSIPLIVILMFALLQPARPLSSATADRRSTDVGSIVTTAQSQPIGALFTGSSRGLKLEDWSRLIQTNRDETFYANKPAKFSGFVYDAGLGENTIWVARFVLTCCAVDVQPIGIPVQIENWQSTYDEDEWIEVEGEFSEIVVENGSQIVLTPNSVKKIERPNNPYAY